MNKKRFDVTHEPTGAGITVEIDFDHVNDFGQGPLSMDDTIKMMVDFWSGSNDRIKENDGSYLNTFLKQLCEHAVLMAASDGYNVEGLRRRYNTEEGYCTMDGRHGIKIVSLELLDLSGQEEYQIDDVTELCAG